MWRHPTPHDTPRPWQSRAMVVELVFMMSGSTWCRPYVVVRGISGLVVDCLCVGLVAYVQGKAGLHEDVQTDAVCKALGWWMLAKCIDKY